MPSTIEETYKSAIKFLEPLSLREVYELSVKESVRLVKADYGSVFLYRNNRFSRVYSTIPSINQGQPRPKGNAYKSIITHQPLILTKKELLSAHPEMEQKNIESLILIPLRYYNKSLGVIALQSKKKKYFSVQRLKVLKLISSIASLGIRNAQLYQEMKATVKNQSLFIRLAAHELRTPLTTISAYVQLFEKEKQKLKHPEWFDSLSQEIQRLTNLIFELMEAEQIKKGSLEYAFKRVTFRPILEKVLREFSINNPERILVVGSNLEFADVVVKCDEGKIIQAINNIFNNAVKFSPEKSTISVDLFKEKNYLVLTISDQGKGIAKKDLTKIFDKYYRGQSAKQGLGIGLYLTKHIIEAHHGIITITSKLGKGTSVTIRLPKSYERKKRTITP